MPNTTWLAYLVAFGGATGASIEIARAQCAPPTEEQCYENPLAPGSYFATECGRFELEAMAESPDAACNQIIAARAELARGSMIEGPVAMPAQGITTMSIGRYDMAADPVAASGLASHYTGVGERYQSAALGNALIGIDPRALRDEWDGNGKNVTTCEEYVYERYYDYSLFEDAAATLNGDFRAMFVDGHARLANGVHSKGPNAPLVAPMPDPAGFSAKNVYFTYRDQYPPETEKYQFADDTLVDRLNYGKGIYRHTMAWHGRMDQKLTARWGDPMLYALAEKQREFIKLLEERAAIMARYTRYDEALEAASDDCVNLQTPPNFSFLKPWWKYWNPDYRVDSWNLTHVYVYDAFDGLAIATPYQVSALAPGYDEGVLDTRALSYGVEAIDLESRLAAFDNPLDQSLFRVLAASPAVDTDAPPLVSSSEPSELCLRYTSQEDGLPLVGPDASCAAVGPLAACLPNAREQVAAKLREIDARIEQAMLEVAPYNCTDLDFEAGLDDSISMRTGVTGGIDASPCDWNPEMFVREAANHFGPERERAFRQCVEATGGTFDSDSSIKNALRTFSAAGGDEIATPERAAAFEVPRLGDYTGDTELATKFFAMVRDWAAAVEFQRDPRTGKPIPGHSASDSDHLGNSMFGIAYGYSAGWRLGGLPQDVWGTRAACDVQLSADAAVHAKGTVFGFDVPLLDAFASVGSTPTGDDSRHADSTVRLEILGVDILADEGIAKQTSGATTTGGDPVLFHVAKEVRRDRELASMTFVIAGVPVTVRAGIGGRVGLEFTAKVDQDATCESLSTAVTGKLLPSASLDAFVSGGVNLAIVEIGLQIDLTLIRFDLPFELGMQLAPQGTEPMIIAHPKLSLALTSLSGRFRAYLKFPVYSAYVTLFSWDGVQLASNVLFAPNWNYPLGRVALGLKYGAQP